MFNFVYNLIQKTPKEDEIATNDSEKKTRYLNLKIDGTIDDFNVKLGKEKKRKNS